MELVADRFARHDDGSVVDLATGARVVLRIATAGGIAEQTRWTLRCDFFRSLQHRAIAPLVDYGPYDDTSRLEAWQAGAVWRSSAAAAAAAHDRAARFLKAAGRGVDDASTECVYEGSDGPIVIPSGATGYPDGSVEPAASELTLDLCAMRFVHRPVLDSLREMFERISGRPIVVVVWGAPGCGRRTTLLALARVARTNGFVPVAAPLIESPHIELLRGRTLFVIGYDASDADVAAALRFTLESPQPHVIALSGVVEHHALENVRLPPIPADGLCAAVYPRLADPRALRRIERAARQAGGLPGRFIRLLWEPARACPPLRHRASFVGLRAAEPPATYGGGGEDVCRQPPLVRAAPRSWPAPRELAALRERVKTATALIARGRHAPGIRQLRAAIGALARRDDWSTAADGALALSAAVLHRGRPREALTAIGDAHRYATRASRDTVVIDAAVLAGHAWIDLGRLDEAEAVLAGACASARALRHLDGLNAASTALGRCLYWKGRYEEATLALAVADWTAARNEPQRALLAARIAAAEGRLDAATEIATSTHAAACEMGNARICAAAAFCQALVRCRVGDLDAAERDVMRAVESAHTAHDPLRVLRARLLAAAIACRRGHRAAASAQLARIARLAPALPPIVRARSHLLSSLLTETGSSMDIISRHVKTSGFEPLPLYAGGTGSASDRAAVDSLAAEVVAIVRACQTADDEGVVLKQVCGRVRQQLHAAGVAFVSGPARRFAVLASEGPRIGASIAERAITAGIAIAPMREEDRIEAAVPVLYGGAALGALCARWILGSTYDLGRANAVLELAAAAAAPVVAALAARTDTVTPTGAELLGVTSVMAQLRHAVERAASAPFPVLVVGESGSGKELVARAIHRRGPRRDRAFCTLNCAALPDDLVEAELFGHARGAFTGAIAERAGVFEEAHGGTLFLDEIGELSARAQAKVLRVIQEGELRRVGENLSRRVDVRIVAATNRDLRQEADGGRFRTDLLYRLDVVRIAVPALRERREDIVVLAEQFWRDATARVASRATLSAAALAALARYDWPGNVRELQNVLAALAVRTPRRGVVPPDALPPHLVCGDRSDMLRFVDARRSFEERFVRAALARNGGRRVPAAAELGVSRQGLTKLMERLGIATDDDPGVTADEGRVTGDRP